MHKIIGAGWMIGEAAACMWLFMVLLDPAAYDPDAVVGHRSRVVNAAICAFTASFFMLVAWQLLIMWRAFAPASILVTVYGLLVFPVLALVFPAGFDFVRTLPPSAIGAEGWIAGCIALALLSDPVGAGRAALVSY